MKKTLTICLIAAVLIPFTFSPASAGPRNNHLFEAVIIGTGVAILSSALLHEVHHNHKKNCDAPHPYHSLKHHGWQKPHFIHYQKYQAINRYRVRGYWGIENVWVPPVYKKRWGHGYHQKQGRWKKGRRKQIIVRKGYWEKRRMWIRND